MRGGGWGGGGREARAKFFACYSIDSVIGRLETEAVTCIQLSSCSVPGLLLNGCVSFVSFVRFVRACAY